MNSATVEAREVRRIMYLGRCTRKYEDLKVECGSTKEGTVSYLP
jgi:hypothetical protein